MCKQALLDGKKLAEKALKRVQAKKKAEDSKKRRLTAKAQALEVTTLVKIVSMKVDIPNIVCPHCECGIAPGEALAKAHREVQKGRSSPSRRPSLHRPVALLLRSLRSEGIEHVLAEAGEANVHIFEGLGRCSAPRVLAVIFIVNIYCFLYSKQPCTYIRCVPRAMS